MNQKLTMIGFIIIQVVINTYSEQDKFSNLRVLDTLLPRKLFLAIFLPQPNNAQFINKCYHENNLLW